MTWNEQISNELAMLLAAYLRGEASVDDVFAFEVSLAHDDTLDPELRGALGRLSLVGDEVSSGWAPESDFAQLARETLTALTPPAAVAD